MIIIDISSGESIDVPAAAPNSPPVELEGYDSLPLGQLEVVPTETKVEEFNPAWAYSEDYPAIDLTKIAPV
jgi:hypothetical protein